MDGVVGDGRVARRQRRRLSDRDRARGVRVGREVVTQAHPREVDEVLRLAREVDGVADADEVGARPVRERKARREAAAIAHPVGRAGVAAAVGQARSDGHGRALQVGCAAHPRGVRVRCERAGERDAVRVRRPPAAMLAERALERGDELAGVRRRHGRTIIAAVAPASPADAPTPPQPGDDELLAAARAGDDLAFLALARRHHGALRALARCWPGAAHAAEQDVAAAWLAILGGDEPPPGTEIRALVAREIVLAAVDRAQVQLGPAPQDPGVEAARFFGSDHERWPGEWADPPRPWGSIAARRLGQGDIPRLLARCVHELGVARSAVVTLCDVHGWPASECAIALGRPDAEVRAFLRAGRESLRAVLEAEIS